MKVQSLTIAALLAMGSVMTHAATMSNGAGQVERREPEGDVVVTSGEAIVQRAPDQAFITMTVESRAKVPGEAQKAAANTMTAVQQKLAGAGFTGDAVRTLAYDLQPEYDYHDGRQTLRGYVARTSIEVRVEPVQRAGEVIDLAVQSGATAVSSLRFDLKGRAAVEREALTKAVQVARARAEAAAAGIGRSLDRVLRIEDHGAGEPPIQRPVGVAMRMAADQATTPVQPGEVEIRARVSLTVKLK
jgi:uncharacterized protein YggE